MLSKSFVGKSQYRALSIRCFIGCSRGSHETDCRSESRTHPNGYRLSLDGFDHRFLVGSCVKLYCPELDDLIETMRCDLDIAAAQEILVRALIYGRNPEGAWKDFQAEFESRLRWYERTPVEVEEEGLL
jgi:hypothetical protein